MGILDARSAWKPESHVILPDTYLIRRSVTKVRLQPSCSLQFLPYSSKGEKKLTNLNIENMVHFALEKLDALISLADAAVGEETMLEMEWNWTSFQRDTSYDASALTAVRTRLQSLQASDFCRSLPYEERKRQQIRRRLPALPLTTVGSFPQTHELRLARRNYYHKKSISEQEYRSLIKVREGG